MYSDERETPPKLNSIFATSSKKGGFFYIIYKKQDVGDSFPQKKNILREKFQVNIISTIVGVLGKNILVIFVFRLHFRIIIVLVNLRTTKSS